MPNEVFLASGVFFSAYETSDFVGKLIFLALFALSFLTWFVLVQKVVFYRRMQKESLKFEEAIKSYKESVLTVPNDALIPFQEESEKSAFIRIFLSIKNKTTQMLEKNFYFQYPHEKGRSNEKPVFLSPADIDLIETQVNFVITSETKRLEKNLFILATAVSLAPFLGILGTVWGVLVSLGDLQHGGGAHSNSLVLAGLSTALATTVLGLFIAIPALISYNYLKNSLKALQSEMYDFSHLLLSNIELQYRKVDLS